eukprot:2573369-Pleurochrysis_carterae.AAC.1
MRGAESSSDAPPVDPSVVDPIELDDLEGFEALDSTEMQVALKLKYGNHAHNVVDVLRLWKAYAEMFSAWREEWTGSSK